MIRECVYDAPSRCAYKFTAKERDSETGRVPLDKGEGVVKVKLS
jgi:hypothetical protein